MTAFVKSPEMRPALIVWGALVVFTVVSFAVGDEHVIDEGTAAAAIVIGFAAAKIRLVGIHFMELGNAPLILRGFFETYCAVLFIVLMGIYLIA